jgi:hypothetical protein
MSYEFRVALPSLNLVDLNILMSELDKIFSNTGEFNQCSNEASLELKAEQDILRLELGLNLSNMCSSDQGYGYHPGGTGLFEDSQGKNYVYVQQDLHAPSDKLGKIYRIDTELIYKLVLGEYVDPIVSSESIQDWNDIVSPLENLHYSMWEYIDSNTSNENPRELMRGATELLIDRGYLVEATKSELNLVYGTTQNDVVAKELVRQGSSTIFNRILKSNSETRNYYTPDLSGIKFSEYESPEELLGLLFSMISIPDENTDLGKLISNYSKTDIIPFLHGEGYYGVFELKIVNPQLSGTVNDPYIVFRAILSIDDSNIGEEPIAFYNGDFDELIEEVQSLISRYEQVS